MDNKGPLILTYYMGKFFKDLGTPLPYSLRMMAAVMRKAGMGGVEYYIHHYEEPVFLLHGSEFPLCNGEKGCLCGNFTSGRFEDGAIMDFQGGMAHNAVAGSGVRGYPAPIRNSARRQTVLRLLPWTGA